jgi:DNA-binding GntR family transcriptional regulator
MYEIFKINDYDLLSTKVYRILKSSIIKGDLKPGEKLLESKIAEQLGVSRTPVREALQKLATEGFVKMEPNSVIMVHNFSFKDLKEILQIRRVLEGLAASVAAEEINQEEISQLEKNIEETNICVIKNDLVTYLECNAKFHNLIFQFSRNERLIKISSQLVGPEHRLKIRELTIPGRFKYYLEEHQKIVEALKRRDAEQAAKLSQKHAENILKNILVYEGKGGEEDKNALYESQSEINS